LWPLQRAYYLSEGVRCWSNNVVPNFVTTNTVIAASYARVILGFLRDWFGTPGADKTQPVYVIEVGSGHGKFVFLLLRELMEMHELWPDLGFEEEIDDVASVVASSSWRPCDKGVDSFGVSFVSETLSSSNPTRRRRKRAPFRIVITDFFDGSSSFWESHESFQTFFDAGVLDFAILDAECAMTMKGGGGGGGENSGEDNGLKIYLNKAKAELSSTTTRNPVVCICNYVFDTLRQSSFKVVDGKLYEGRASIYSNRLPDDSPITAAIHLAAATVDNSYSLADLESAASLIASAGDASEILKNVQIKWTYEECTPESAFPDPVDSHFRLILSYYQQRLQNASILIPIGGISLIRAITNLGRGRALLLAGDKAYNHEEELLSIRDPHVALHGSFSFMANFNSVRLFTLLSGGWSLQTPYFEGFKCSAFVMIPSPTPYLPIDSVEALYAAADVLLPSHSLTIFSRTCYAWADTMDIFGPENFSCLQRCVSEEIPNASLRVVISLIRMSNWDPDVFFKFKQTLIDKSPTAPSKLQADIYRDVRRIYERYFPLQPAKDIAFELGRICMGLKRYSEAVQLFIASQRQCGEHHITSYNIGICLFHMNALETALVCFDRTLYLKPDYVDAKSWVARVEAKKAGENFTATERAASTAAQVVKPSNISEITSSEETDSLLNMDSLNVSISVSESDASREITTPTTPVMPRRV
jgi:tetratricopeptide (TPR) repeat protein